MIKRPYNKKQTLTQKEIRFCELYITRVKNKHSPLDCMREAGFYISRLKSTSRMDKLLADNRIIKYMAGLNVEEIPTVEEKNTESSKAKEAINILQIIGRLKIEAGMTNELPDDASATSRIGALRSLIEIYYKHAQPTDFVLPDYSPLQRIDFIVKTMAAGEITVDLGRTLIQSIQTRMDIHAKTELLTRVDDIERKLRSNANAQKGKSNVVKIKGD